MKPGDKVMVPRTGGGYSLGEVLEIYTELSELRLTQREERFDD